MILITEIHPPELQHPKSDGTNGAVLGSSQNPVRTPEKQDGSMDGMLGGSFYGCFNTPNWNTPRKNLYQQAIFRDSFYNWPCRGIASGVRYRGVLSFSWNHPSECKSGIHNHGDCKSPHGIGCPWDPSRGHGLVGHHLITWIILLSVGNPMESLRGVRHVTPTVLQCVTTLRSVVWTLQQRRLNDSVFHRACFWISKPPMTWDPVILRYANFPTSIIFFLKIFCQFGVALNSVTWTNTFHENLPFPEIRLWVNPTWRIIPLSKELATPIYKTFGQFGRGPTTPRIGE